MKSFIGKTQLAVGYLQSLQLKGDQSSFPIQGLCKVKCKERIRLFSFKLEEGEENVIIIPKNLVSELGIFIGDKICLEEFERDNDYYDTDILNLRLTKFNFKTIELQKAIVIIKEKLLESTQPLNSGYQYIFTYEETTFQVQVRQMYTKDPNRIGLYDLDSGLMTKETNIVLETPKDLGIKVIDNLNLSPMATAQKLFGTQSLSFQELGIGGLNEVFGEIIDLVLLPKLLSIQHQKMLQIEPSRGFILEGPPGTGKSLLASILGTMLKAHVKIVRGPEMVTKYVGQGAQLVRELFQEASYDWQTYGVNSPFHVILIDEIDSLCPQRGSNQSVDGGATDQIVATFLTMIQGIQSSNNFVVIGTTNRVQTIDKALLRPGRFSHIFHIGYPNDIGRKQIWEIHLQNQINAGIVNPLIIPELVKKSEGLSGAMIKSCVTSAIFVYLKSQLTKDRNSVSEVVNDAVFLTQKLQEGSFKLGKEYLLQAIRQMKDENGT